MPLPAGFTAQHYNDLPMFEVSPSARAKYRAFVEKAWSDEVTARAAFAAQSLSKEDTRYKVARLMAGIFGNEPETTFFGETLTGGYQYSVNEWDHDSSLHERNQGIQLNSSHVPPELVPFPYTTNNPNIRHTNNLHRQIRIYSLSGSMAWPWTYGPVFADLSNVDIEWLLYQGAGTPANSLQHQFSWFSAGERGHAGQDTNPATNPFGMENLRNYAINTDPGGKIIRENLVPNQIPDPRTIADPAPVVTQGLNHFLIVRTQVRLTNNSQTVAMLGGRFVFGNKRGVSLEQFSAGGGLNNPPSWISRNAQAIPYWAPIIGAPDVVIINYTTTGEPWGDYDAFYDNLNTIIDIWKQANPNVLIILTGNQYSAGLPANIGSNTDYRTHYPSVFRQIALEREDVMFFNITRWLDNRANHTPAHSVGGLGDRDKGVWNSSATYSSGDVVRVTRTSGDSPEARGITQYYVAISDIPANQRPGIDAGGTALQTRWALFNEMINDDLHPSGELERHRCLAYAQLLSGTFPDRTANELLGVGGSTLGNTVTGVGRSRVRL